MDSSNNVNDNDENYSIHISTITQLMRDYIENMNDYHSNMRHLILFMERLHEPYNNNMNMNYIQPQNQTHTQHQTQHQTQRPLSSNTQPYFTYNYTHPTGDYVQPQPRMATRNIANSLYTLLPNNIRQRVQGFMEDVVVRPTQFQIDSSVEYFVYDPSAGLIEGRCPISLEDFCSGEELSRIRYCHHVFKRNVLQDWFSRNVHCPVCRYDIRDTPISIQAHTTVGNRNPENRNVGNRDSENIENRNLENRNLENRNLENRNLENRNSENDDIELDAVYESLYPSLSPPENLDTNYDFFRNNTNTNTQTNATHPIIQTLGNALHSFIQNEVENNQYMNEFMYTFDIPIEMLQTDLSNNRI